MLIQNEATYAFGESPMKEIAHFEWDFGEKLNANWYTMEGASPLCSSEAAIAMGVASFTPVVGPAIGVAALGVTVGCATNVF